MTRSVFWLGRVVADVISIPLIFVLAYSLKFKVGWVFHRVFLIPFGQVYDHAQIEPYLHVMGLIVLVWMVTFYFGGVYRRFEGVMPEIDEFVKIAKCVSIATIELMAISFLYREFPGSRMVLVYSWVIGMAWITVTHGVIRWLELWWVRYRGLQDRVLVLGSTELGLEFVERLHLGMLPGAQYVGSITTEPVSDIPYSIQSVYRSLGKRDDVGRLLKENVCDIVIVVDAGLSDERLHSILHMGRTHSFRVVLAPDFRTRVSRLFVSRHVVGVGMLDETGAHELPGGALVKRCFDIGISLGLLILLSPIFLVVSGLIWRDGSGASVLYRQKRVGLNGVEFDMVKFRSMTEGAEAATGPVLVDHQDQSNVTSFGRWMRRWSVDELPQLWNVLKGEMSLVGPRPERPYFVDQYRQQLMDYDDRHRVRGGITGWAQINGRGYMNTRPEQKLKYDLYYIGHWSFVLDIKIILKTMSVVLTREQAY